MLATQRATHALRQRFCRARECGAQFFLCRACDRGQQYCSAVCRRTTRVTQRRAARQRHQRSPAGRLDHRDRQRAYRRRQAQRLPPGSPATPPPTTHSDEKNVTDHASQAAAVSGIVPAAGWRWPAGPPARRTALGTLACRWCGRVGRWLNPFFDAGRDDDRTGNRR